MMRRLILALCIAVIVGLVPITRAQTAPVLEALQISFWPEYDRPATLVIYRGLLSAETPLPASLEFRIPAAYGPPLAVAFSDGQGLFNLNYTTRTEGDELIIAFETPAPSFQFEYYDTSLDLTTSTRQYNFAASAPYAIEALSLQVQQPIGAMDIEATPALPTSTEGNDGLVYLEGTFTNLAPNDPITLNVTYTKTADTLSANTTGPAATPQLPDTTPMQDAGWLLPVGFGVLALLVIGGASWYVLQKRSDDKPAARVQAKWPKGQVKAAPAVTSSKSKLFCHNCGHATVGDDRFCRNCGTELRRQG
jgi:hypothetical protein